MFTGVFINAALIICGSLIGFLFKTEKLKAVGERVMQAFALFVLVMGVSGALDMSKPMFELVSLIVGISIGELLDIDAKFNKFGAWLQKIFMKGKAAESTNFSEGFINATLLFCIGSMTFLGAFEAGLQGKHTIYITKGVLDGISALTLSITSGISVMLSAAAVIIYQGLLVVMASLLEPVLTEEIINLSVSIGSLFIIAIGTNILGMTKIKVANFLPAMFIPIIYQVFVVIFS